MKKMKYLWLLALLFPFVLSSCSSEDDIVFSHELPQFETQEGKILLEVIMPYGTALSEDIYIVGAFNGGQEAVLGTGSEAPAETTHKLYVNNQTGYDAIALYAWGDGLPELFGGWPGATPEGTETVNGVTYSVFSFDAGSQVYNPILNNNGAGWQVDGPAITLNRDYYFNVTTDGFTEVTIETPAEENPSDKWKLTPAPNSAAKWGIYLDPNDFQDGKTLADGFYFVSATQREEVTLQGDAVIRTDNPATGTRTDLTVQRWASYFDVEVEEPVVEHDGYTVFVVNATTWDDFALYMWGDVNNLNGDWPGMAPTGTQTIGGVTYTYFDMGADNEGLSENLIFNNGGNGIQHPDYAYTIDHDIYLRVTDDGVEELQAAEPTIKHDGYVLYVLNQSSQTDLGLYAWGDAEAFGGWPGMAATGTQTVNGNEYTYFDLGSANTGLSLHLIPNNNGGGVQWEGDDLFFTIDHDIYVRIYDGDASSYEIIDKDYKPGSDTPTPTPAGGYKVYVDNQTGWGSPAMYAWADGGGELFGGWPGASASSTETIGGVTYLVFTIGDDGGTWNLILNNGVGDAQANGPAVTATQDYYYQVTADGWTQVSAAQAKRSAWGRR